MAALKYSSECQRACAARMAGGVELPSLDRRPRHESILLPTWAPHLRIFAPLKSSTLQKSNFRFCSAVCPPHPPLSVLFPPHPALAMLNVVGALRGKIMMSSTARHSINIALWGKGPEGARSEVTFLGSWKHVRLLRLALLHLARMHRKALMSTRGERC